jgi:hypothetical protein
LSVVDFISSAAGWGITEVHALHTRRGPRNFPLGTIFISEVSFHRRENNTSLKVFLLRSDYYTNELIVKILSRSPESHMV